MKREEMKPEEMEVMVPGSTSITAPNAVQKQQPLNQRCRFKWLYVGLGVAFLTIIVAITIVTAVPKFRQSTMPTAKQEDNQIIILKTLFGTNYISNNKIQTLKIKNIDDITNQLNTKLNGNKIQINDAFFLDGSLSNEYHETICENPLSGNALQLNIVAFYSPQCAAQNEKLCKTESVKELENVFKRMLVIPIKIQFNDNRLANVDIKMCTLIEMPEGKTEPTSLNKSKVETEPTSLDKSKVEREPIPVNKSKTNIERIPVATQLAKNVSDNLATPYMVLKRAMCNLNLGTLNLIQLAGEGGTRILDDTRRNVVSDDDPYQQFLTVTLYEDTTYRLHIQFNCNVQSSRDSTQNGCDQSQIVNVWIDYNDDGYDEGESRILKGVVTNKNKATNTQNLDLYIPPIDNREIRAGLHNMRVAIMPSIQYLNDCGYADYKDIRRYKVNIVPKGTYSAVVTVPPSNQIYKRAICSENSAKIALVIMAGERATEIRDDIPQTRLYGNYQNQHHLQVTIYEHTIYLLRVQLDCTWQLNSELFNHGCNLAQEVNVWIDLNDDSRFDQAELATPYRWPVTSYMPLGNYDLQLNIPYIDNRYIRTGKHRMRVVVQSTDYYRRACNRMDYNETRDYTVNIIPRTGYVDTTAVTIPPTILSNIVCSRQMGKIIIFIMAGEHRTQIRDDSVTGAVLNSNNRNQQYQTIVLYEGTVYLSRIQLDCSRQWNTDSLGYPCHLIYDVNVHIDLNDDGIFSSSEDAVPFRWPLDSYTPKGIYDLQIYIPVIDGNRVKTGPHRMQLVVTTNEYYRKKCSDNDYTETREFTVSIIPNTRQPVDAKVPYLKLSDNACSLSNGKLALAIMAGEQGTEIRDNILQTAVLPSNQNRHHLSVTLYEGTFYRLRVTLDCYSPSGGGLPNVNCNLAQDVNVYIDLNNDDKYDETESRVSQRWPLHSTMPLGIYDFEVEIPVIDRRYIRSGPHKMRIVVVPSEEYYKKCGRTDYRESVEYTINIISRPGYPDWGNYYPAQPVVYPAQPVVYPVQPAVPPAADYGLGYCSVGNLACAIGSNGISLVNLVGEQNTQIYDELKACNAANNYYDQSNFALTLFDSSTYTLQIEIFCVEDDRYGAVSNQDSEKSFCHHPNHIVVWLDYNNDGILDENQGEMVSNNWHEEDFHKTTYDLTLNVPQIDRSNNINQGHKMRIILVQDESNRKPCYNSGYGEARDYTVRIIPNPLY